MSENKAVVDYSESVRGGSGNLLFECLAGVQTQFHEYASKTTVHGIRYILEPGRTFLERFVA